MNNDERDIPLEKNEYLLSDKIYISLVKIKYLIGTNEICILDNTIRFGLQQQLLFYCPTPKSRTIRKLYKADNLGFAQRKWAIIGQFIIKYRTLLLTKNKSLKISTYSQIFTQVAPETLKDNRETRRTLQRYINSAIQSPNRDKVS